MQGAEADRSLGGKGWDARGKTKRNKTNTKSNRIEPK